MAQTTSAMPMTAGYLGISTDGSSWTDISGHFMQVSWSGGSRNSGAAYTADGDTAIIKAGKRTPLTVTASVVYTETASEPFDTAMDQYETAGGGDLYLRWSPGGGDSGDLGYTTTAGIVKEAAYPQGAVETGEPIPCAIVVECASITRAAIGTAGW